MSHLGEAFLDLGVEDDVLPDDQLVLVTQRPTAQKQAKALEP